MKILSEKERRKLLSIIAANQLLFDTISSSDGLERFEIYSQFCENCATAAYILGGTAAVEAIKEVVYGND